MRRFFEFVYCVALIAAIAIVIWLSEPPSEALRALSGDQMMRQITEYVGESCDFNAERHVCNFSLIPIPEGGGGGGESLIVTVLSTSSEAFADDECDPDGESFVSFRWYPKQHAVKESTRDRW